LPALLGALGDRVDALRIPIVGRRSVEASNPEGRFWGAIVRSVLRRPGVSLAVSVAVLLALASPIFGMHIGTSGVTLLPSRFDSRQGFTALERAFPGATTDPVEIVVAKGATESVIGPAPWVIALVLGLTLVFLTLVFRSLVVAATAVVLNLLSVGAAYGLLVLVFQHGFASGLFGFRHVDTIEAWVPLFLFSVLFGLSMDYQVFLLSRIKERFDQSGNTSEAVTSGVASTARIITGAALIIIAVFAGFAAGELVMFQQMGFGVAAALLIDATLIRSVVLPATMHLLGRWNWYLPRWLDWLPRVQVEGSARPARAET
jgi:RND superfamily putative drug exporter